MKTVVAPRRRVIRLLQAAATARMPAAPSRGVDMVRVKGAVEPVPLVDHPVLQHLDELVDRELVHVGEMVEDRPEETLLILTLDIGDEVPAVVGDEM